MRALQVVGWSLAVGGWCLAAAIPLTQPVRTETVAVVFPPWASPDEQMGALTEADVFVLERRGPITLVARSRAGLVDTAALRRAGALLILDQTSLTICTQNETPLRQYSPSIEAST